MTPRVFVSSTYYDLKHVRERLEKFIENYGFEPILFESDKVTYQHGKEIDQSAYYEVSLCHIMVLIVGGRYGSPSSLAKLVEERKRYDEEYISITRKEFETASQKNIPILIFIDKNVYSEYQTYKENQEFFDELYTVKEKDTKENKVFKFAHVDHVSIFKFIDIIRTKPLKTFEKVEEIESYIKSQLSGMFYLYLESLKKKSDDNKILDTISELNNVTLRMNEMLTSVGKEVLGKDKKEYEKVIESQLQIMIDFFAEQFSSSIQFEYEFSSNELSKIDMELVTKLIYDDVLKTEMPRMAKNISLAEALKNNSEFFKKVTANLQLKLSKINDKLVIKNVEIRKLNRDFKNKVLPFIRSKTDEDLLLTRMKTILVEKLDDLPF
jgi:hypothetical protein